MSRRYRYLAEDESGLALGEALAAREVVAESPDQRQHLVKVALSLADDHGARPEARLGRHVQPAVNKRCHS